MPIPAMIVCSNRHSLIALRRLLKWLLRYSALQAGVSGSRPNLSIPVQVSFSSSRRSQKRPKRRISENRNSVPLSIEKTTCVYFSSGHCAGASRRPPVIRRCRTIRSLFSKWMIRNFPCRAIWETVCPVSRLQNSSASGYAATSGRLTATFVIIRPWICGSITLLIVSTSGNSGIFSSVLSVFGCLFSAAVSQIYAQTIASTSTFSPNIMFAL